MEQTIFEKRGEEFASVQVRRTATGVELVLRSKQVEAFCRTLHEHACREHGYETPERIASHWDSLLYTGDDQNQDISHLQFYRMPNERMLPASNVRMSLTGMSFGYAQTLMLRANPPVANMFWFRAVGLGNGVTIPLAGLQMRDTLKAYSTSVKQTLTEMYAAYLRPFDQRVVFTSEILEVKS